MANKTSATRKKITSQTKPAAKKQGIVVSKKTRQKNLILLGLLAAWVILFFVLTLYRLGDRF